MFRNSVSDNAGDTVLYCIERFYMQFLMSLIKMQNGCNGKRIIIYNPWYASLQDSKLSSCEDKPYRLKLNSRNSHCSAQLFRTINMLYHLRLLNDSKTKRDLFYEQKNLFGTQQKLNVSISRVQRLFGVSSISGYVLSSGRGLVFGPMKIIESTGIVDCSIRAVIVEDFTHSYLYTSAHFILVVEKDATFQKLISEGFSKIFPNGLLVTGRGYPDFSTRIMLQKLNHLPLFGLMDCDPHGIEIAMTYKYGSSKKTADVSGRDLPHFEWIGLSRSKLPEYLISSIQFLTLQKTEICKVEKLVGRAAALKDRILLAELKKMRKYKNKLELEALSGIAPGFLSTYLLRIKLSRFAAPNNG